MLSLMELLDCDPSEFEKVKLKKVKPKKTNEQKRLIAANVALYCMSAAIMSTLPGFIVKKNYNDDIAQLDNKQTAIYEQFMACEEFSDSFKAEFTKASNDYANGLITYEEFDEKVKHLNSVKYAQEVLATSNNTELKTQVEDIDKQKQDRTKKYQSNPVVNAGFVGLVGIGTASIGAMVASTVYSVKDMIEEKRKKNIEERTIELKIEYDDSIDGLTIKTEEHENTL